MLLLHASSGPASRPQPLRFATLHLHLVGRGLSPPSCRTCSAHLLPGLRPVRGHCGFAAEREEHDRKRIQDKEGFLITTRPLKRGRSNPRHRLARTAAPEPSVSETHRARPAAQQGLRGDRTRTGGLYLEHRPTGRDSRLNPNRTDHRRRLPNDVIGVPTGSATRCVAHGEGNPRSDYVGISRDDPRL